MTVNRDPWTGGWATPTMGAHLSLLPKGFAGEPYRSTDGTIFVCVEGQGATKLDEQTLELKDQPTRDMIKLQLAAFAKFIERVGGK